MNNFKQFNATLEDGLSKWVFDHVRNFLICSFILALGVTEFKEQTSIFLNYSGVVIIGLSGVLFSLNLYDGIRRIAKYKYHSIFIFGLILLYLFISIRVVELALNFRTT